MIAYKFLAAGAVAPFTGFAWPRPGPGGAEWVSTPPDAPRARWVHACRPEQLAWWLDEELWRVELGAPVHEELLQVVAPRARLLARVEGWNAEAERAFAEACTERGRRYAAEAGRAAAPYLADAERHAGVGRFAEPAYVVAVLAQKAHGGDPAAFDAERLWQGRWLAEHLGLR